MRDLVGHTSRALSTVETHLDAAGDGTAADLVPAAEALAVPGALAASTDQAARVLMALTGRAPRPAGWSLP